MSVQTQSHEAALIAFMERFEPVTDLRSLHTVQDQRDADVMRPCGGGCGREVGLNVAVCVRCRNASAHPALRSRSPR